MLLLCGLIAWWPQRGASRAHRSCLFASPPALDAVLSRRRVAVREALELTSAPTLARNDLQRDDNDYLVSLNAAVTRTTGPFALVAQPKPKQVIRARARPRVGLCARCDSRARPFALFVAQILCQ